MNDEERKERTLVIANALAEADGRDLDDGMAAVAGVLPDATVREVVAVLFEGCTDEERREFEEGVDIFIGLDEPASAWLA